MTAFEMSTHKKNCPELHMTNGLALDVAPVKHFTVQIFSWRWNLVDGVPPSTTVVILCESMCSIVYTRFHIYVAVVLQVCTKIHEPFATWWKMKIGKLCTLFAQNSFSAVWRVWGKPVGSIFSCHAPTSPTACKVPVWHHLEFPDFISKEGGHIQGAVCRVPPIGALFKPSDEVSSSPRHLLESRQVSM